MFDDLLDDDDDGLESGDQGVAIGIDLGTTNSCVAAVVDGAPKVLADASGARLHPSVVAWTPDGERLVGKPARLRSVIDPVNTVHSAKRIIGQPFSAPSVQSVLPQLAYRVEEGENQESIIVTRGGRHAPPEISAFVLSHLRAIAETVLETAVTHCVVTVPANFSDTQRAATRRAAELAGMEVLRILNEPTAAAVAYGASRSVHQRVAVFDLGGGTFDISVLAVRDNLYEVVATGGDPFLGGDDIDHAIADRLAEQFLREHRIDLNQDPASRARLRVAAEQVKVKLSRDLAVQGSLADLAHGPGGRPLSLKVSMDRDQLEALIAPLLDRALRTVERVLAEGGLSPAQIDEVILVGGPTRIPLIQRRVGELFGQVPRGDINPMETVAIGAAAQAQTLLSPSGSDRVLLDVTPHSLRVATAGGFSRPIIAKNTHVPAEGHAVFTTSRDDQSEVVLRVCQGEESRFDENAPIGELTLHGLPKASRGEVELEVSFVIDADGVLQVSARDRKSGVRTGATLAALGMKEVR
jgi:molecular chaperone DnaK